MNDLNIRRARIDDVPSCLDIYNYEVVNGVATMILNLVRCQSGRSGLRRIKRLSTAFL